MLALAMLAFSLGSLGFMTNFRWDEYKTVLPMFLEKGKLGIDSRMRLKVSMGQDERKV